MDISERKHGEELRDMFIGMLSHELRTPVTAIYAGGQLLLRDGLDGATRAEVMADVVAEAERLERMVENLLVLARVERNALLGGDEPVVLRPIAVQVAAAEERRAPAARVVVDMPVGLPPVRGDAGSIELALRNLVSNAIKYGPRGGVVTVRASATADGVVEVRVLDAGPGFGAAGPDRVFDLFYRAPGADRIAPGAGIGLYVVRSLIASMGGSAWARDREEGGAELGFALRAFREDGEEHGAS
jgi:signal transduction histidine kinase